MKRCVTASVCACILLFFAGCESGPIPSKLPVQVNVSGSFRFQQVGGGPATLTATVTGDTSNQGVAWTLSQANVSCSPGCGTLKPSGLSAVYTPPTTLPTNQQATISARSNKDNRQDFAFNFQITGPISVSIAPKFTLETEGGPAVTVNATVNNDPSNPPPGVTWALTSSAGPCAPACGMLTPSAAPSLSASYTPPNAPTSGPNASPTITATSVADPTKSDSFGFTLVPPPISVSISNKFTTQTAGGPAALVSAVVTNDQFYSNAGVTWSLTSTVGGTTGPCSPACGTLTPSAAPSVSANYTPPATAPTDANASPTITATSVTDPTQSDSFSFNIVALGALFKGGYVFQLRGFDASGSPMAVVGTITSDGAGNISGGELDSNDNFVLSTTPGLSGTYSIDSSFNGIPRLTICLALVSGACSTVGGPNTVVLKGALSSDGTRGKIIEYDNSLALMAGSMLKQDPTALNGAGVAGSYAFELDSDVGTSILNGITTMGRIVEAGQLIFGAGATSITGGVADAAQAQQPTYLAGGATPATIAAGSATSPDVSGRGTFTLSVSDSSNGNTYTTNYAYYVVNAQQLDLIEVDTGGSLMTVQSGTAQRQNTLTATSFNTTSVVALTGSAAFNGATSTAVIIGVVTISGTSVSGSFESNFAGGNPNQNPGIISGSVFPPGFDPNTGRGLLFQTLFTSAAVYLYDTGKGFMIDITSGGTSRAFSGPLIPQAQGPFSASDIAGNYIGVAGGSSSPSIPNLDFALNFDASGNFSTVVDFTNQNLGVGSNGQVQNFSITELYELDDIGAGLGKMSFPSTVFGDFTSTSATFASFYIIGPRQLVAIGQGPGGTGGEPSGILFFDPQ